MEMALKLINAIVPLVVELIKQHHANDCAEDQQKITEALFSEAIDKAHNGG